MSILTSNISGKVAYAILNIKHHELKYQNPKSLKSHCTGEIDSTE